MLFTIRKCRAKNLTGSLIHYYLAFECMPFLFARIEMPLPVITISYLFFSLVLFSWGVLSEIPWRLPTQPHIPYRF